MLKIHLLDNCGDYKLRQEVVKYINKKVQDLIEVIIDYLEDNNGFTVESFIYKANSRTFDVNWLKLIYELYDIVRSDREIDYLKPNYEFLLHEIIEFGEELDDIFDKVSPELVKMIKLNLADSEYILEQITNFEQYYDILFYDFDFLPEIVERMTTLYIRNKNVFELYNNDVDLDEYSDLMPMYLFDDYSKIKLLEKEKNATTEKVVEPYYNKNNFFECLNSVCLKIQRSITYKDQIENVRNDYVRDLLEQSGYCIKDQTRQGTSSGGKDAGRLI